MTKVQELFDKASWDYDDEKSLKLIKEEQPHCAFPDEIWKMLTVDSTDFNGRKILVPSSGDNFAVFAFSLLGSSVTSTDFNQNVLDDAKKRANEHGLSNIEFINVDTMTLSGLPDNEYDLIFTSNGVYNCLNNIQAAHENFFRVLKPNGIYCFYENHPFYNSIEEEMDEEGINCKGTGKLSFVKEKYVTVNKIDSVHNFHTIEDYINSLLNAGFTITNYSDVKRSKDALPNLVYKTNTDFIVQPMLPVWIGISAVKKCVNDKRGQAVFATE